MTSRRRKKNYYGFLPLVFAAGLVFLLYPSVSNYWNSFHASQAISGYAESVARLDGDRYKSLLAAAEDYNAAVTERENIYELSDEECRRYGELLNVGGDGVMGYIEIPKIGVSLPVYHGTEDSVLQVAVGHIEWTSLPVGGEGTHCVLSGHRGLPSARLFTDLDKLEPGDTFVLRVLGNEYTYIVDQTRIVLPEDIGDLQIEPGKDLCTLVTCTPYGINSHRLLVRGTRTENPEERVNVNIVPDAGKIPPELTAAAMGIPMLCTVYALQICSDSRKRKAQAAANKNPLSKNLSERDTQSRRLNPGLKVSAVSYSADRGEIIRENSKTSEKRRQKNESGTAAYSGRHIRHNPGDCGDDIQFHMQRKGAESFKENPDRVQGRKKSAYIGKHCGGHISEGGGTGQYSSGHTSRRYNSGQYNVGRHLLLRNP